MSTAQILFDGVIKLADIWAPVIVLAFVINEHWDALKALAVRHG